LVKASLIRQLVNDEFVLMRVSTSKESTLNTCYDVASQQSISCC